MPGGQSPLQADIFLTDCLCRRYGKGEWDEESSFEQEGNEMGKTTIKGTAIKKSGGEKIFEVVVYVIATVFCIYCLFPFAGCREMYGMIFVTSGSFHASISRFLNLRSRN